MSIVSKLSIQLIIAIVVLLFTSCDALHTNDFYVENTFADDITFIYKPSRGKIYDTVVIPANSTSLVYTYEYVYGQVGVSSDRGNNAITDFKVIRDSTEKSIDRYGWNYEELSKFHASFTLKVDSSLLE